LLLPGLLLGAYEGCLNLRGEHLLNAHRTWLAYLLVLLSYPLGVLWEVVAVSLVLVRATRGDRPTRLDLVVLALALVLLAAGPILWR
jgi:hypothetical protein